MKANLFIFFIFSFAIWALDSKPLGTPRILIERDAPGGIEQASVHFEQDAVIVYSNSNFTISESGISYLGHFKIPYDQQLNALKDMLAADFASLDQKKSDYAQLNLSEQVPKPPHHELKVYLNQYPIVGDTTLSEQWRIRLLIVLKKIQDQYAVNAVKTKIGKGKLNWEVSALPSKKVLPAPKCKTSYCVIDGFGKLVP